MPVTRYLEIKSGVSGKEGEAFRLLGFSGHEELSRLFRFNLQLESDRHDIQPAEIVGKPVTFNVLGPDNKRRHFHGLVNRFSAGTGETGFRQYQAEVVPWLWFLTRTSDCRLFAKKKVPDILETVFGEAKVDHPLKLSLKRTYQPWVYCVQYRETDFNFVSRLMEQEGIFYYFEHKDGAHTLVLGDDPSHYYDLAAPKISYVYSMAAGPQGIDVVHWNHQYQFISARYAQTDYNFEKTPPRAEKTPAKLILTQHDIKPAGKPPIPPDTYELFDYPAEYEEKEPDKIYSQLYLEEEEATYDVASGQSYCHWFSPGGRFTLEKHPAKAENAQYALLAVDHSAAESDRASGAHTYTNQFSCLPAKVPFRAARTTRKPSIQGVQTAVVVGPPGSEINTDKYGRIQVQFFWDRYNARLQGGGDAKKQGEPVWIRVGQTIAGKSWGSMFIPRVGQEVMVAFEEGDPDRPLVTGVLYNDEQMPPYDLPAEKTKSYVKTNSSPGGEGYNELRFEDKKGSEQIFVHAERNMDVRVKNDSLERIIGNRHQIIGWEKDGKKGGDQREMVYQDQHKKIHRDRKEHVGGNMELLVGGIDGGPGNVDIVLKGQRKELVEKDSHLHVKKSRMEKIDVDQSLTVGNNQQEKVGMKHAVEAGQEIHLKAGMKVVIEAGLQMTIKGPGGFVDIGPAGVTIQGTLVNINSGGAAGAGSGSQPDAPQDAKEAQPTEPTVADNHKSGKKSTPF